MLKELFRRYLKQKQETEQETEYEKKQRLLCEKYFEQKNLVKWQTKDLPCVTLEALDDCGLITISDTVVYLPAGSVIFVKN